MESADCKIACKLKDKAASCCFWLVGHYVSASSCIKTCLPMPCPIWKCLSATILENTRDYLSPTPTFPSKLLLSIRAIVSRIYLIVGSSKGSGGSCLCVSNSLTIFSRLLMEF